MRKGTRRRAGLDDPPARREDLPNRLPDRARSAPGSWSSMALDRPLDEANGLIARLDDRLRPSDGRRFVPPQAWRAR
jgi:hypothetical protein